MTDAQLHQMVDRLLDTLAGYDDLEPVIEPYDKTLGLIMACIAGREMLEDGDTITGYISVYTGRA